MTEESEKTATILLVDDNPENLRTLRDLLKDQYDLKMARSGARALDLVEQQELDLILLDIQMPEMDGFEVLRRLKENPETMDIPVLMVTAEGKGDNTTRALEMGAVDYIEKPVNREDLLARVSTHIELKKKTNELQATIRALEERIRIEEAKHTDFTTDPITGLCNRAEFIARLQRTVKEAERPGQFSWAVLSINLERVQEVEDSHGTSVSDSFLQGFAKKLEGAFRETDALARFELGHFFVLLSGLHRGEEIEALAAELNEKLFERLTAKPFKLEAVGVSVPFITRVGVRWFVDGETSAEELIREANLATPRPGEKGNVFGFSTPDMTKKARARLRLESDLRRAIPNELQVFYQPKVDLTTSRIIGMEALVRWRKPDGTMVFPDRFIPLAEETGLVIPMGWWVLQQACRDTVRWREIVPNLKVAVNLAGPQLKQPDILDMVESILDDTGLPARALELEIMESMAMENPEAIIATMHSFRGKGIQLAMDDFGTGHSGLARLKQFPLDVLKIDQAFVRDQDLAPGGEDRDVPEAIIVMGRNRGFKIVAEGIENEEAAGHLIGMGAEIGQGYYYSRPVPADEFETLLRQGTLP